MSLITGFILYWVIIRKVYKNAKMQKYKNSKMQKCKNAKMQRYKNAKNGENSFCL
jgi:hypothetical protein